MNLFVSGATVCLGRGRDYIVGKFGNVSEGGNRHDFEKIELAKLWRCDGKLTWLIGKFEPDERS